MNNPEKVLVELNEKYESYVASVYEDGISNDEAEAAMSAYYAGAASSFILMNQHELEVLALSVMPILIQQMMKDIYMPGIEH